MCNSHFTVLRLATLPDSLGTPTGLPSANPSMSPEKYDSGPAGGRNSSTPVSPFDRHRHVVIPDHLDHTKNPPASGTIELLQKFQVPTTGPRPGPSGYPVLDPGGDLLSVRPSLTHTPTHHDAACSTFNGTAFASGPLCLTAPVEARHYHRLISPPRAARPLPGPSHEPLRPRDEITWSNRWWPSLKEGPSPDPGSPGSRPTARLGGEEQSNDDQLDGEHLTDPGRTTVAHGGRDRGADRSVMRKVDWGFLRFFLSICY
ncbi:hypothetical protein EDB80DRAFT_685158 [Ilyonectria destructans]|nr:hypothetical protein EDB80DRAFT_685158 [Ilyonectria destructans]